MQNLKQKTIKGLFWSAVDSVAGTGLNFVVLIILARLLSPEEFGLVGLTAIFIAIGQVMVDGGLGYALIRKQDCTDSDYSTVFYFNVGIGVVLYFLLYFSAPLVASFFEQSALTSILRIIGLYFVFGSLTSIQQTILIKRIDFRSQAVISLIAAVISGSIAIYMAYTGWGVWALVWRTVLNQALRSLLLWIHNKWLPSLVFDKKSFAALFHFGYKLMIIYLTANIFKNIYNAIIGKTYTVTEVGYYNTADQYASVTGGVISSVATKVTYPVFSSLQHDKEALKRGAKQTMEGIMFITLHVMIGIALVAKPLVILLMGAQWEPAAVYLQALCLAYMATPMHSINQNIMNALGCSDLFLRTEIVKYILLIPIIVAGIYWGLPVLIWGFVFHCWLGFFINAWYSKKLIGYSIGEQLRGILPAAIIVGIAAAVTFFGAQYLIPTASNWIQVIASLASFGICSLIICIFAKPVAFKELVHVYKNHGIKKEEEETKAI